MCGGVQFQHGDAFMRMYFPNPKAMLPVLKRDGGIILLPWGRRQKQPGVLPLGGWARIDSVYAGVWDRYFPKPVKIPALGFMEKDFEGNSHWYDLQKGQFIQGLVARDGHERRIYVVTIEPEPDDAHIHSRWPRVVQQGERRLALFHGTLTD